MKALVLIGSAVILTLLGGYYVFDLFFVRQCEPAGWPTTAFTRRAWLNAAPEKRYEFVNSILTNGVLKGATREVVVAELGEPSKKSGDGSYFVYHVRTFGDSSCILSSFALLDISFDASGKVTGLRTYTD